MLQINGRTIAAAAVTPAATATHKPVRGASVVGVRSVSNTATPATPSAASTSSNSEEASAASAAAAVATDSQLGIRRGGSRDVIALSLLSKLIRRSSLVQSPFTFVHLNAGPGSLALDDMEENNAATASHWYHHLLREYAGRPANDDSAFTELGVIASHYNSRAPAIVPGVDLNAEDQTFLPSTRRSGAGRVFMAEPMKFSSGFTHLPLSPLVAQRSMRSFDRAILAEANETQFKELRHLLRHDDRYQLLHSECNAAAQHAFPIGHSRALHYIDCGRTPAEVANAQKLIDASAWHMPWAQHLITYPLVNGDRPVELIRTVMATGCKNILGCEIWTNMDDAPQPDGEYNGGVGAIFINPPEGFDVYLRKWVLEMYPFFNLPGRPIRRGRVAWLTERPDRGPYEVDDEKMNWNFPELHKKFPIAETSSHTFRHPVAGQSISIDRVLAHYSEDQPLSIPNPTDPDALKKLDDKLLDQMVSEAENRYIVGAMNIFPTPKRIRKEYRARRAATPFRSLKAQNKSAWNRYRNYEDQSSL